MQPTEQLTNDSLATKLKDSDGGKHDWRKDLWAIHRTDEGLRRRQLREKGDDEMRRKLSSSADDTLKNLVVMVQWADHTDRCDASPANQGGLPPQEEYDLLMNSEEVTTDSSGAFRFVSSSLCFATRLSISIYMMAILRTKKWRHNRHHDVLSQTWWPWA